MARQTLKTLSDTEWGAAGKAAEMEEAALTKRATAGLAGPATVAPAAPAPAPTAPAPTTRLGQVTSKLKNFPGVNAVRKLGGVFGKGLGLGSVYAAAELGRGAIDAAGDAVARAAGMPEVDIADANRRLSARTGGVFGQSEPVVPKATGPLIAQPRGMDVMRGVPPRLRAPKPGPRPTAPAAPAEPSLRQGAPVQLTSMRPNEIASANAGIRAGDIRSDTMRPGTGMITASDGSSGTRIDGSSMRDAIVNNRQVLASREAAAPKGVFGAVSKQNNERYEERKAQARYGLETQRLGATATSNVARARLGMEVSEKSAKALNESVDRWATVPSPDGKGTSQVDPMRRNQINTFITEALSGPDGRLPQGLLDDPRVIDRVMPTIIQALDQGVEVSDLAANPGFMRTIWDTLGITSPAMTTSGDYRITNVRKATLGDAITNKDVGLTDWAVGRAVGQTDTGVVRTMRDFNKNDVQRLRGTQRRLPE